LNELSQEFYTRKHPDAAEALRSKFYPNGSRHEVGDQNSGQNSTTKALNVSQLTSLPLKMEEWGLLKKRLFINNMGSTGKQQASLKRRPSLSNGRKT